MTESIYKKYQNKYYNPNDNDKRPGDNDNWKSIQKGFHDISTTQLETSAGLTLGKGTEDETSVTAGELEEIKNPTQLETSGGLTLGKGTEDETSVTAAELEAMKQGGGNDFFRIVNADFDYSNKKIALRYSPSNWLDYITIFRIISESADISTNTDYIIANVAKYIDPNVADSAMKRLNPDGTITENVHPLSIGHLHVIIDPIEGISYQINFDSEGYFYLM